MIYVEYYHIDRPEKYSSQSCCAYAYVGIGGLLPQFCTYL